MARLPKVDQPYTQDRATISEFIDTYEDDLLGFLAQRAALNDPKQLMTKRRREASAKLIDVEAIGAVLKVKHDSSKTHERKLEFWRQVLIALGIVFPDLHDDLFADHRDAPQENAVRKAAAAA